MDLQKFKILLDKINALYKNMSADARNISSIEKDLMRSYVLQLYDAILDATPAAAPKTPEALPLVEIPRPAPKIQLTKPEPPPLRAEPAPTPVPKPEPARVTSPPPKPPVVETPPPIREPEPSPAPRMAAPTTPPGQEAPPPPKPEPLAPKPAPVALDDELEEIFAFSSAKELSEKLSELPIADIKKAMGLNEKIFTQNELFGADQALFDRTMDVLNQFKSYEEAKNYLAQNIAGKYGWTGKDKKSKAKNFVKLVKRRYA